MLRYAIITNDTELMELIRDAYEYTRNFGIARIGWFTETSRVKRCEGCCIADMVALAIKLSDAGVGDYWDDVDRYVRNQLIESQFTNADLLKKSSDAGTEHKPDYPRETDDRVIERVAAWVEKRPSSLSTVDIWHMGGAISRFGAEHSAIGSRGAPYLLGVEANWEPSGDDAANIAWTRECTAEMREFSDGSQYLNFPGFYEGEDETMRTTFGDQYERLVALKTKYDPSNLFRLNQNIKPESQIDC